MDYTSLEQRMAGAYLATFPDFFPQENGEKRVAEQRDFYDLMKRLYQVLFDDPALIVPAVHEDDAFPTRYKKGYGKPRLEQQVLKSKSAVEGLLKSMFFLGQGEAVKLSKRQRKVLSLAGLEEGAALPPAWTWMSQRPGADPVAFAYCLFEAEHVYTPDVYARLLGEEPFRRLEAWMLSHGYRAYDQYNAAGTSYQLTLTYANPAWGPERPSMGNEYKIRHTGICAQYDAYVRTPTALGLCIPNGLKPFLEHFDSMSPRLQAFVLQRTKTCDGCRYCVQTDKTGTRPLACMPVAHQRTEYRLCPYFPGYRYSWTSLDEALVDNLTEMLTFMDGFAGDKAHPDKTALPAF